MALEGGVGGAGDCLAHVGDAVDHVPVVVVRDGVARRQARVGLGHGEQAVDLVRDRGGEDGHALVPVDGLGEIVVLVGVVDPLEAHALCAPISVSGFKLHPIRRHWWEEKTPSSMGSDDEGEKKQENILGIRLFHLSSVSFVKNSDVFMGAYDVSYSNRASFWGNRGPTPVMSPSSCHWSCMGSFISLRTSRATMMSRSVVSSIHRDDFRMLVSCDRFDFLSRSCWCACHDFSSPIRDSTSVLDLESWSCSCSPVSCTFSYLCDDAMVIDCVCVCMNERRQASPVAFFSPSSVCVKRGRGEKRRGRVPSRLPCQSIVVRTREDERGKSVFIGAHF